MDKHRERLHTCWDLSILIHYYTRPGDFPQLLESPREGWPDALKDTIRSLLNSGMIRRGSVNDDQKTTLGDPYMFRLTEGGSLFVQHLLTIPFPKQIRRWEIIDADTKQST